MFQNWPIPKSLSITSPTDGWLQKSDWQCQLFPFFILLFALWSLMMDPLFVWSENGSRRSVTLIVTAVQ
jgi:hypothetical protein